jgi:calcineurin-like phosphoesterase family protein
MEKLVLTDNDVWFMSDPHYNHKNICRGTTSWDENTRTRPFDTLEEMNNTIVNNINNNVMENDWLIGLGDFAFGGIEKIPEFRNRINCKNIIWILGNHDHHIEKNKDDVANLFTKVKSYLEIKITKNKIEHKFVLCHYPIASWHDVRKGTIHLHGHVHFPPELKFGPGKMMDVGFDGSEEFRPYSFDEIINVMSDRINTSMYILDETKLNNYD